ncbi:MAG: tail fiber domain-containing protein [Rhodanobacteraceae bacterium]
MAGPLTLYGVQVREGSFSTEADFGSRSDGLSNAWVGVQVRAAGGSDFTALDKRSPASIDAATGTCSSWALDGNAGNPAGSYLGTADNQPLVFEVDGQRAGFISATGTANQPNLIFGSSTNTVASGVVNAVISGGVSNSVTGAGGVVAGGAANVASGVNSFAVGFANTASAFGATVPGGQFNTAAGPSSFAGGFHASANHDGSFVWSDDSSASTFGTTASDQFLIRASGGVGIGTSAPNAQLAVDTNTGRSIYGATADTGSSEAVVGVKSASTGTGAGVYGVTFSVAGPAIQGTHFNGGTALYLESVGANATTRVVDTSTGAYLTGAGEWHSVSDRNAKSGFTSIDAGKVLAKLVALPVTSWHYKIEGASVRHIGPMAQDFSAAFGLGNDNKTIGMLDQGGIAFAAIQGLNKKIEDENSALKAQNAALVAKLDQLADRVTKFEVAQGAARAAKFEVAQQGE